MNGELRTTLHVRYAYKDIGGYRLYLRSYEGTIPGPTLRVRAGDVLRIRLVNDLPPNPDPVPVDMALPHHFNTTNFHFHGLHVSPEGISDNIFRSMEPGQSYDIEIAIPGDHPRGTYWYHPHHHGSADVQITGGMAGALIIEGDFDDIPEIAGAAERCSSSTKCCSTTGVRSRTMTQSGRKPCRASSRSMDSGSRPFACGPARSSAGGLFMPATRTTFTSRSRNMLCTSLPMTESEDHGSIDSKVCSWRRASVPTCWCRPERSAPTRFGRSPTTRVTLRPWDRWPRSSWMVSRFRCRFPPRLVEGRSPTIRDEEITNTRRLTLSVDQPEFPPAANYQEFRFLVCGRTFDPNRVDQRIPLGAVEEWTVVNEHDDDHVFHIHTNPFQMVAINGEKLAERDWRDTVVVPRNGSVTFRSRFLDFTGRFVHHCHMMNHEELGMMQVVEVYAS